MRDREGGRKAEKSVNDMERERALNVTEQFEQRRARPLVYAMSRLLVNLSYAIVGALVFSWLLQAFLAGAGIGVRGLAAASLPPLILTYITLFTRLLRPQHNIPDIALFLSSAAWIIAILLLVNFLSDSLGDYPSYGIPLSVFVLSITLSGLVFINKYLPFSSALSNAFGIVIGVLIYTLLFGITYIPY